MPPKDIQVKPKILVIEDEYEHRFFMEKALQDDFNILIAGTGHEAFDLFKKNIGTIDLILMDMNLPDCSGFEIFRKMQSFCFSAIPNIIITSAISDPPNVIKQLQTMSAFHHLAKPIKKDLLLQTINQAIFEPSFARKRDQWALDYLLEEIITAREKKHATGPASSETLYQPSLGHYTEREITQLIGELEKETQTSAPAPWKAHLLIIETPTFKIPKDLLPELEKDFTISQHQSHQLTIDDLKKEKNLDIILTDVQENAIDIFSLLQEVKHQKHAWWTPNNSPDVLIITASEDKETIVRACKSGVYHYLLTPLSNKDIQEEITKTFQKRYHVKTLNFFRDILENG